MEKEIFFDVIESDVYVRGSKVPSKKALINSQTHNVIGIVGKNYVPVQNNRVFNHFVKIMENSSLRYEVGDSHLIRDGSKSIIEIKLPDATIETDDEDFMTKVYLINSFDGHSRVKLKIGLIRLVCENGMVIEDIDFAVAYKHIGKVNVKLVEQFKLYLDDKLDVARKFIKQLNEHEFESPEHMENIIINCKWMPERYAGDLLYKFKEGDRLLNAWYLYNVFTYVITHKVQANIERKLLLYRRLSKEALMWNKPE